MSATRLIRCVNTGTAFVGTIGEAPPFELTALGDPVNLAARLASAAHAGQILVTFAAAQSAGLSQRGLERRNLELKGKSAGTSAVNRVSEGLEGDLPLALDAPKGGGRLRDETTGGLLPR